MLSYCHAYNRMRAILKDVSATRKGTHIFIVWANSFNPLLGHTKSQGRCWAAYSIVSSSRTVKPWGGWWIGQKDN